MSASSLPRESTDSLIHRLGAHVHVYTYLISESVWIYSAGQVESVCVDSLSASQGVVL